MDGYLQPAHAMWFSVSDYYWLINIGNFV
jgi:hypothetical protein